MVQADVKKTPRSGTSVPQTPTFARRLAARLREALSYCAFKVRRCRSSIRSLVAPVDRSSLSAVQLRILAGLETAGYAMVSLDELFASTLGAEQIQVELEGAYLRFRQSAPTREAAERYTRTGSVRKEYLIRNFPNDAVIPHDHPLVRLCQHTELQDLLRAFFGETPRLIMADYWLTLPAVQAARTGSQNWHRDHEDQKLVKLFVYLSDVNESSGATEYIEGSFHGGPRDIVPPKRAFVIGDYFAEEDLNRFGLLPYRRPMTGPKWTMVFVNTSGFHRGGFGMEERAMANITFTTQASGIPARFRLE